MSQANLIDRYLSQDRDPNARAEADLLLRKKADLLAKKQQIDQDIAAIDKCSEAVAKCRSHKQIIAVRENGFVARQFGRDHSFCEQCTACLRKGPPQDPELLPPRDVMTAHRTTHEEVNAAYSRRRDEVKRLEDQRIAVNKKLALVEIDIKDAAYAWWELEKADYYSSNYWRNHIRTRIISRDHNLCQGCLNAPVSDIHHRSYDNWRNEWMWELIGLCRPCHADWHNKSV